MTYIFRSLASFLSFYLSLATLSLCSSVHSVISLSFHSVSFCEMVRQRDALTVQPASGRSCFP
jgi:hypothetical protein